MEEWIKKQRYGETEYHSPLKKGTLKFLTKQMNLKDGCRTGLFTSKGGGGVQLDKAAHRTELGVLAEARGT